MQNYAGTNWSFILFEDAIQHVYIKCIKYTHWHCFHHHDSLSYQPYTIESPRGNVLPVGITDLQGPAVDREYLGSGYEYTHETNCSR